MVTRSSDAGGSSNCSRKAVSNTRYSRREAARATVLILDRGEISAGLATTSVDYVSAYTVPVPMAGMLVIRVCSLLKQSNPTLYPILA